MPSIREHIEHLPQAALLRAVGRAAEQLGVPAYAVGGVVRDALLGRETTDVDFVTVGPGSGLAVAEATAAALGGRAVHVYPSFGTAAIRIPGRNGDPETVLEFVAARRESYRSSSRKPEVEEGTLMDDLARRDFTINAMAVDVHETRFGELVDPFGGMDDLGDHVLRTPLPPARTFEDDPLRMIRAARFATQLQFRIDREALDAMQAQAQRVSILSQERITDELQKILCAERPSIGFAILQQVGILPLIFPELSRLEGVEAIDGHRHKDNFHHTLQVVDNLVEMTWNRSCDETLWLRWAAL
ncbi:MAG TPA: tRNA nucleotidyltransferase, partial [Rhodothermales bacterium]